MKNGQTLKTSKQKAIEEKMEIALQRKIEKH